MFKDIEDKKELRNFIICAISVEFGIFCLLYAILITMMATDLRDQVIAYEQEGCYINETK